MSTATEQYNLTRDKILAAAAKPEVDYDTELDDPRYHDPEVVKGLEEMTRRYVKSSNQDIEEALRQYELSYNHEGTRRQRWGGQQRWQGREAEEMRLVRVMHPYSFIRRLQLAGVDARIEEHRNARIWLNSWSVVGLIGVNARIFGEAQTVTTIQYPYAPEYSLMHFKEYDIPTNERYKGWRTTLLVLIRTQVITEAEAMKAFGPAVGPASEFYREQLQTIRRVHMGLQI